MSLCVFGSGIGGFFIGQARQIVHAGVQGQGHPLALLKAQVALSSLDLGVGALIDAREHLHFHLCVAPLLAKVPKPAQLITQGDYGKNWTKF